MHAAEPTLPHHDPALTMALDWLRQHDWHVLHAPGIGGGTSAVEHDLFYISRAAPPRAGRGYATRNILTREELLAFTGQHAAIQRPATPAQPPAAAPRSRWALRCCLALLALSLTLLAAIGAAEVLDNTLTLYRSLQP